MVHGSLWKANRERLLSIAEEEGIDTLVVVGRSNIIYATGIRDPSGYLILSRNCPPKLLVPLLDYYRILDQAEKDFEVYAFYRGGEEGVKAGVPKRYLLSGSIVESITTLAGECGGKVGVDAAYGGYTLVKDLLSKGDYSDASRLFSKARRVKSPGEIELVKKAAEIAEEAFTRIMNSLVEGVSEAEIASLLALEMRKRGAWGEAFPTIVAFYANSALPHHSPGQTRLGVEGPVLIDWGAIYWGYRSDMTRTMWWGSTTTDQFQRILESVEEAVNAALDVLGPGVVAAEVDNAARVVLDKKGLARYFVHGLGHGVGVDIHEEPYLRPGSKHELEPGMIVTIEPGVYLPGLFGVRIEHLALVTPSGFQLLTRLPSLIP